MAFALPTSVAMSLAGMEITVGEYAYDEAVKLGAMALFGEKYGDVVDGVYTTSGISEALCRYLDENKVDAAFVAFDTHEAVRRYMKKGVVCAAIDQNVTQQMACAFEGLVKHIISGEKCEKVIYTDVQLVLKSNMHQFGG